MVIFRVPASATHACYRQQLTLSGVRYTLELRFNTRMGRWLLSVLTLTEVPVLLGIPLLVNTALLQQYPALPVPEGEFVVVDNSGADGQPGLGDFLRAHVLLYLDPSQ